jgi:hypothetical protein
MFTRTRQAIQLAVIWSLLPGLLSASRLECPDAIDNSQRKEIVATSAPEVKVRTSHQNTDRWWEITKPLTRKAIKLAKEQRAEAIAQGVENLCKLPDHYVAQIIPYPNRPSGCEHKIVSRPAEEGYLWVQVVATCRYEWACCRAEENAILLPGSGDAGAAAEAGPVTPGTTTSAPTPSKRK